MESKRFTYNKKQSKERYLPHLDVGGVRLGTNVSMSSSVGRITTRGTCFKKVHLRFSIHVARMKVGEGEVNIAFKGLILAVEELVDHLGDELAGVGNDESVRNDGEPPHIVQDVKPDPDTADLEVNLNLHSITFKQPFEQLAFDAAEGSSWRLA